MIATQCIALHHAMLYYCRTLTCGYTEVVWLSGFVIRLLVKAHRQYLQYTLTVLGSIVIAHMYCMYVQQLAIAWVEFLVDPMHQVNGSDCLDLEKVSPSHDKYHIG